MKNCPAATQKPQRGSERNRPFSIINCTASLSAVTGSWESSTRCLHIQRSKRARPRNSREGRVSKNAGNQSAQARRISGLRSGHHWRPLPMAFSGAFASQAGFKRRGERHRHCRPRDVQSLPGRSLHGLRGSVRRPIRSRRLTRMRGNNSHSCPRNGSPRRDTHKSVACVALN